jgi:hypothetical protein
VGARQLELSQSIEIKTFTEIDDALFKIDQAATEAINTGKVLQIEWSTDASRRMTGKQRGALHVWCDHVAKVLNEAGMYFARRIKFNGDEVEIDWDMYLVKEHIYKPMLEAMTGKLSTEDQDTVDPSKVVGTIQRHFALNHGRNLPDWPSLR